MSEDEIMLFSETRAKFIEELKEYEEQLPFESPKIKYEFLFNKVITLQIALEQIIKYIESESKEK